MQQQLLILAISLHVLSGVFWAGTTFTLARTGAGGERLFGPQMGAALIAVLSGASLWNLTHEGAFGTTEQVLSLGAVSAILAAAVQGTIGGRAIRLARRSGADQVAALSRFTLSQRLAAAMLAVTVVCMAAARYVW